MFGQAILQAVKNWRSLRTELALSHRLDDCALGSPPKSHGRVERCNDS